MLELLNRLVGLQEMLKGLGLELILATIIYFHHRRFGSGPSSQQSFGPVLPFVALTTFLVISVVRSSFALSLGMVGALSIVRFRTPVKDPFELAYIFLAIASGIGAAAGQRLITAIVTPLILLMMLIMRWHHRYGSESVLLSVDVEGVSLAQEAFDTVSAAIRSNTAKSSFMRYEIHQSVLHLTAETQIDEPEAMSRIVDQIRATYPTANVSFHDASNMPAS